MSPEPTPPRRPKPRRVLTLLAVAGVGAIIVATLGIGERAKSMQEVRTWTEDQAPMTVRIVHARRGPGEEDLTLPGTVNAFASSTLFARVSGYVTAWNKDIGAKVKKGEILAEISAPDLDQQLAQAKAQLVQLQAAVEQAQANADLSDATNKRTSRLASQGWSSEEKADTDRFTATSRKAALDVAKANIVAQQAAVGRLEELTRFEQIRAPFDGTVTARSTDIGDLINAGGTTGHAMFQVADVHRMRIYVNVPQAYFSSMKPGLKATLTLPGRAETFDADLVSTSGAVAENSRMALVQLQADNRDGKLWPGAFAEVQFHIPSDPDTLRIPTTALIFTKHGMQVAAVDASNRVDLQKVTIGRNLGNEVEIKGGLSMAARLIDNPQESIAAGDVVRIADETAKGPAEAMAEAKDAAVKSD